MPTQLQLNRRNSKGTNSSSSLLLISLLLQISNVAMYFSPFCIFIWHISICTSHNCIFRQWRSQEQILPVASAIESWARIKLHRGVATQGKRVSAAGWSGGRHGLPDCWLRHCLQALKVQAQTTGSWFNNSFRLKKTWLDRPGADTEVWGWTVLRGPTTLDAPRLINKCGWLPTSHLKKTCSDHQ